ncbi:MAG TPA: preprotein translocase subunit YajC [Gaiellaceae bacterium]|nr:preprotein translocase subunit YajC [Gaiellaceae bacterium]
MSPLIVIVIIVGFGWFLLALPARRRSRAHVAMQDAVEVGDEVITAGGLHAVVRELGETELRVEIAPSVLVTLDRRAVAAVAQEEIQQETPPEAPDETPPEPSGEPS